MGSGGAAAAAAPERCPAPHPAVLAWGRLTGTAAAATRVSVLKRGHKSQVYRLHGLLDGRAVIAKRCPTGTARIERTVHERILPGLPIPTLCWYGFVQDEDAAFGWLFTEVAGDEAVARSHDASPIWRCAATPVRRWRRSPPWCRCRRATRSTAGGGSTPVSRIARPS